VPPGLQRADVDAVRNPERAIEQLPTSRQRLALYGKVAHRFENSTLRIDERLYTDSWGLLASTTDGQFFFDVSPRVRVWPHARLHAQTGANFWQIAYESEQSAQGLRMRSLRTGDRELGPLFAFSLGGGGRLALGEDKNWGLTLSGDVIYNRYLNHLYILERLGVFGALGAEVDIE
jgi:hypothetical protein